MRAPVNSTTYDILTDTIVPFGYAGQPLDPQPFAVEDVVILTDGFCASGGSTLDSIKQMILSLTNTWRIQHAPSSPNL